MSEIQNSIYCTLTDIGLQKSQEASHNTGYFIKPVTFGVSQGKGIYSSSRSFPYSMWYQALISSYQIIDANTVAFYCDIPEDAYPTNNVINEIYLFAQDFEFNSFLLCLGQIDELKYIPGTSIRLKIVISILQFDILSVYKFENSIAKDIEEHNNDPNAHSNLHVGTNKSNTVVIDKDTVLNAGDVVYCNTNKQITLILPSTNITNGDSITVIDHSGTANENHIIISSNNSIDGSNQDFVINQSGGKVTFFWNSQKNIWNVDIEGRLNNAMPQGFNPNRKVYYTDYFTNSISVYNKWTDYRTGELVIYNNNIYRCIYSNNFENLAIPGESNSWEPITFGYSRITIDTDILKDTPYTVIPYIKGSNMIKVYIDGILCNSETYYEDPDIEKFSIANTIYFKDDIPSTFVVEVLI